ncbi:MAG: peptide-binding protein [Myxococcota bacterium]
MSRHAGARRVAPVALAILLALGCQRADAPTAGPETPVDSEEPAATGPVRGDWLVLALLSDPENLNPVTSNDAAASSILSWIFPGLLRRDNQTLAQRPQLALDLPEISEDKLHYTFRLRRDVTFADAHPMTARDAVFAIKVIKNPRVAAPHARNYFLSVRDAVAVDDFTLRVDLREPYFLNDIVLGGISPLPRHYYDPEGLLEGIRVADLDDFDSLAPEARARAERFATAFNRNFQRNPMGPGAFEIRDPERDVVTGERIVLRRRSDFWAPNDPHYGDAWVDRVVYRIINDREAMLVAFKGGNLDVVGLTPLQYTRPDTRTPSFERRFGKKVHVSPGYTYIGWNEKRPLFQDVRVRRALGYFVDKKSIVKNVLFGLGVPVESPIFMGRPEYKRDLPPYPYDPERGKQLLAEAGWRDSDGDRILDKVLNGKRVPLRFEIISNSGNAERKAVGLAVISDMKRAGIDASFREIDWSIMLGKVRNFDYDAVILGWAMSVDPPDSYQVWHSSQAVPGGSNFVAFRNAEVDRILTAYRTEFDPEKRKQLYDRFQRIIWDEQPYTFLYMQKAITAWDRRFHGVHWYPFGGTDLHEWWVPTAQQKYGR